MPRCARKRSVGAVSAVLRAVSGNRSSSSSSSVRSVETDPRARRRRRRRARRLMRYIVALGWALVGRPFVWESESAQAQVGRGGISWVLGCLDGWMGGWVGGVGVSMVTKTSWMLGSLLGTKGAYEQMDGRGRARASSQKGQDPRCLTSACHFLFLFLLVLLQKVKVGAPCRFILSVAAPNSGLGRSLRT